MLEGCVCGPDAKPCTLKHMGRCHSLPGKPLYALKQRLVSSTITAPPICMRQNSVALLQVAVLHGQALAKQKE